MRRIDVLSRLLFSAPGNQARVALATALLPSLSIGLRVGTFSPIRKHLLEACDSVSPLIPGNPTPGHVVSAVEIADRLLPGSRTCLIRSLTAEVLLRLYAVTAQHRIGVAKDAGSMKAHSWIELNGDVLIGDIDTLAQYEPLPALEVRDES